MNNPLNRSRVFIFLLKLPLLTPQSLDIADKDSVDPQPTYSRIQINRGELFLLISQSIRNHFSWHFPKTTFWYGGDYQQNCID